MRLLGGDRSVVVFFGDCHTAQLCRQAFRVVERPGISPLVMTCRAGPGVVPQAIAGFATGGRVIVPFAPVQFPAARASAQLVEQCATRGLLAAAVFTALCATLAGIAATALGTAAAAWAARLFARAVVFHACVVATCPAAAATAQAAAAAEAGQAKCRRNDRQIQSGHHLIPPRNCNGGRARGANASAALHRHTFCLSTRRLAGVQKIGRIVAVCHARTLAPRHHATRQRSH